MPILISSLKYTSITIRITCNWIPNLFGYAALFEYKVHNTNTDRLEPNTKHKHGAWRSAISDTNMSAIYNDPILTWLGHVRHSWTPLAILDILYFRIIWNAFDKGLFINDVIIFGGYPEP